MAASAEFELELEVRDYECDLAGMVNHAGYVHYFEHARNRLLQERGVGFAEWAGRGIFLTVVRVEVDYLFPLRSGNRFVVRAEGERISRLRIGFDQSIHRLPDRRPVARARVIATAINQRGRPDIPPALRELLDRALGPSSGAQAGGAE